MIERHDVAESQSIPPSSTFIVRLWHEGTAEGPRWRGRVEHLQSGESRAFLDVDGLLKFVCRFADLQDEAGERAGEEG
jgi:hypothetical protein